MQVSTLADRAVKSKLLHDTFNLLRVEPRLLRAKQQQHEQRCDIEATLPDERAGAVGKRKITRSAVAAASAVTDAWKLFPNTPVRADSALTTSTDKAAVMPRYHCPPGPVGLNEFDQIFPFPETGHSASVPATQLLANAAANRRAAGLTHVGVTCPCRTRAIAPPPPQPESKESQDRVGALATGATASSGVGSRHNRQHQHLSAQRLVATRNAAAAGLARLFVGHVKASRLAASTAAKQQ